jgi:hypothetical protein
MAASDHRSILPFAKLPWPVNGQTVRRVVASPLIEAVAQRFQPPDVIQDKVEMQPV